MVELQCSRENNLSFHKKGQGVGNKAEQITSLPREDGIF